MPVMPIPDDWNGSDWACVLVEWPDSPEWLDLLRGFVTTPLRGRFWDGRSGLITDAQAIGLEIEQRNDIMSCNDIVLVLGEIRDALAEIQISNEAQATISVDIANNIDVVATSLSSALASQTQSQVQAQLQASSAVATATAWSQSFAAAISPIHITNVFPMALRPIAPVDPPPTVSEEAETGISSVEQSAELDAICQRAYWLVKDSQNVLDYLWKFRQALTGSVLFILAFLADALVISSARNPSYAPALVPIAALLSAAHAISELAISGLADASIDHWHDWMSSEFDNIVCILYAGTISGLSTQAMQDAIMVSLSTFEPLELAQVPARAIFNLTALATMYYVSPVLDPIYPPVPPGYDCELCIE